MKISIKYTTDWDPKKHVAIFEVIRLTMEKIDLFSDDVLSFKADISQTDLVSFKVTMRLRGDHCIEKEVGWIWDTESDTEKFDLEPAVLAEEIANSVLELAKEQAVCSRRYADLLEKSLERQKENNKK